MIVRNLDFMGSIVFPDEANPVLIVDPDAVLSGAAAFQRFQPVAGRDAEVAERTGSFNLVQLAQRDRGDRRPAPVRAGFEQLLRGGIPEALDHGASV